MSRPQESLNNVGTRPRNTPDIPPAPAAPDPVGDAIKTALQNRLGEFTAVPPGPLTVQPAERKTFKLSPSPSGLTVANPLPGLPAIPVTAQVTWKVLRGQGGKAVELPEGSGFDAKPDLSANPLEAGVMFFPQLAEDLPGAATTSKFTVRVSVKLSATNPVDGKSITAGPKTLDVPVEVPLLLLPTLVAFFRHARFQPSGDGFPGFVLMAFPKGSTLAGIRSKSGLVGKRDSKLDKLDAVVSALVGRLNAVRSEVQSLAAVAGNLAGFLTGLRALKNTLADEQVAIAFCPEGANDNLNTMTIIDPGFLRNKIEGEDEISSLIFLGLKGGTIRCYNRRHYRPEHGLLEVRLQDQMCAGIENLNAAVPVNNLGDARVRVIKPPRIPLRERDTFGNAFSSFHFGDVPPAS